MDNTQYENTKPYWIVEQMTEGGTWLEYHRYTDKSMALARYNLIRETIKSEASVFSAVRIIKYTGIVEDLEIKKDYRGKYTIEP